MFDLRQPGIPRVEIGFTHTRRHITAQGITNRLPLRHFSNNGDGLSGMPCPNPVPRFCPLALFVLLIDVRQKLVACGIHGFHVPYIF